MRQTLSKMLGENELEKCMFLIDENRTNISLSRTKEVLQILTKLQTDEACVISATFLDFVRNNIISSETIAENFGEEVKVIIESILKIEQFNFSDKKDEAENLRNMLMAIAKDIRVIMIKLCDILYLARNLDVIPLEQQIEFHRLVADIYAPLSARLGFNFIKSELQNLNLKFFKPTEYANLEKQIDEYKVNRQGQIILSCNKLRGLCNKLGISCEVYGRVKNISSIYNKLKEKHCNLNQIYDLSAIRVIVENVDECYAVLSGVYSIYKPIDGRFKDYIARPKENGYQSLHTTVIGENEEPLEIQIRTKAMHEFAEYGVAAHWLYKEKKSKRNLLEEKLTWIRKLIENPDADNENEIIECLKTDVYSGEIFVQTPKGKIIQLVEEATPVDFAYAIHGKIGNSCVGAKINGKMMPLNTQLANGDMVEIITSQTAKGPSRDWLKFVKTNTARKQINTFFKKEMKEENIKKGKSILEQTAKMKDIPLYRLLEEKYLNDVFERYSFSNIDEMYASIGYGSISANQILTRLQQTYREDNYEQEILERVKRRTKSSSTDKSISIKGIDDLLINIANCCKPIPGDDIVGFISRAKGITVHRSNCPNLSHLPKERLIEAKWGQDQNSKFTVALIVEAKNEPGILSLITRKLFDDKIEIVSFSANSKDKIKGIIDIVVSVASPEQLNSVVNELKNIPNVYDVYRKRGV